MDQAVTVEPGTPATMLCATCEHPLQGLYCSYCGEKKLEKHDRRIVHLFEEFVHGLTHADGKFIRSIKYLLTKPGFLSSEYLAGKRKRYSSPLSLFFIANLIYLFYAPVDTFNSRFNSVVEGQPYSESLQPQVQSKLLKKHWTYAQLEEHYNERSSHEAKLLLIVFVFLLSWPAAILFLSRKRYYYDYVVFAMEYVNFIMYCIMLLIPWVVVFTAICVQKLRHIRSLEIPVNTPLVFAGLLLLMWAFLSVAARRVFGQAWWLTIIKAAVLTVCTVLAMFLYRFLAFEATMFML